MFNETNMISEETVGKAAQYFANLLIHRINNKNLSR